jgi:hypothetical protein
MANKDRIIKDIYQTNFGSKKSILQEAKERHPNAGITYKDVQDWTEKNLLRLQNLKGQNSYVARGPKQVFEVDLFYYNFEQPDRVKAKSDVKYARKVKPTVAPYALIAVDVFTKFVHVEPMDFKDGNSWREALEKTLKKMGVPEMIYTDPDATVLSNEVKQFFTTYKIKHVMTRLHASMAERVTRTIKRELDKRIEKEVKLWTEYLPAVLAKYNGSMVHSATGHTPEDAKNEANSFEIKTRLEINASRSRKYPDIRVGDYVRAYRKRKVGEKERHGVWQQGRTRVTAITESHGQKFYKVEGESVPFIRGELLLLRRPDEQLPPPASEPAAPAEPRVTYRAQRAAKKAENRAKREAKEDPWQALANKIKPR